MSPVPGRFTRMNGKWQVSLNYLLLETFWIAAALGLTRILLTPSAGHESASAPPLHPILWLDLLLLATICYSAAIGGFFGNMGRGIAAGVMALFLSGLLACGFILWTGASLFS